MDKPQTLHQLLREFHKNSKDIEDLLGERLFHVIRRLRAMAPALRREEAEFIEPSYTRFEDPVFLDACYHVITEAAEDLYRLHNEILDSLPSWNVSVKEMELIAQDRAVSTDSEN